MTSTLANLPRVIATLLFCFGSAYAFAEDAAPAQPYVAEAFSCSYKAGKDRADLLSARDYYVKQAARADVKLPPSVVWHQFKGNSPADFVWLTFHENLSAFGAQSAAEMGATEMANVAARFDSVADCTANMGTLRPVFQSPQAAKADPKFVTSSACTTRGDMSPGDVADLRGHIGDVLGGLASYQTTFAFSIVPMTAGPDAPDVYLIGAHDDVAGWAKRSTELQQSEAGQSLARHFAKTMECNTSLWHSERVVGERPST